MKLKMQLLRYESSLYAKILEQNESLRRNDDATLVLYNSVECVIRSAICPALGMREMYIRGRDRSQDDTEMKQSFPTAISAHNAAENFKKAVEHINKCNISLQDNGTCYAGGKILKVRIRNQAFTENSSVLCVDVLKKPAGSFEYQCTNGYSIDATEPYHRSNVSTYLHLGGELNSFRYDVVENLILLSCIARIKEAVNSIPGNEQELPVIQRYL